MGLIHHWKLSDNANDSVGSNNGTAYNLTYADGKMGKCGSFNGTSSYVDIGAINGTSGSPFSLSAWVKVSSLPSRHSIISCNLGSILISSNEININAWNGRQGYTLNGLMSYIYPYTFPLNTWVHLVFTATGTGTAASNYQLFINGEAQTLGTFSTGGGNFAYRYIGRYVVDAAYNQFFNGLIDEVMIYDEVLNANQINLLYRKQKIISSLF